MSLSFLIALATGLSIIVLLLYIIGRMGKLEEVTRNILQNKVETSSTSNESTSKSLENAENLQGRPLWDVLAGRGEKLDSDSLDSIRERYEIILKKHVQGLLQSGYSDAKNGSAKQKPKNSSNINTLRGTMESWLPSEHCAVLYNSGYDLANASEKSDQDRLRMSIDDSVAALFDEVNLPFPGDFALGLINSLTKE